MSKSEVFDTMFDGQDKEDATVYQGENPDALNNIEIGRSMVEGLRDAPAGNPVVLSFALDLNGILQVTAREKQTGLECSISCRSAGAAVHPPRPARVGAGESLTGKRLGKRVALVIEQSRLGQAVLHGVSSNAAAALAADQGDRWAG